MGSPIWEGFRPGNDARVVTNLRRAGALIPGKTVTAEFAVHHPGPTINPHNAMHHPGTSSTGSAVAVATGMVPVALGSQTSGSTIRPASYNGVYGYKPSFGSIPRTGSLKTLDTLFSPHKTISVISSARLRPEPDIWVAPIAYTLYERKKDNIKLTIGANSLILFMIVVPYQAQAYRFRI